MHSAGGNLKEVFLLEYDGKSYEELSSCMEKMQDFTQRQIFVHGLGREVFVTCFKVLFRQLPVRTE
jgi:hypothetical protein